MKKTIVLMSLMAISIGVQAQQKYKNSTLGFKIKTDKAWEMKVDTPNMRYHNAKAKAEHNLKEADILENIYLTKDTANKFTVMLGWIPFQLRSGTDSMYKLMLADYEQNVLQSGFKSVVKHDTLMLHGQKFYKRRIAVGQPGQFMKMSDIYYWSNNSRNLNIIIEYNNPKDRETMTQMVDNIAATLKD